jgi:hypothetical protein
LERPNEEGRPFGRRFQNLNLPSASLVARRAQIENGAGFPAMSPCAFRSDGFEPSASARLQMTLSLAAADSRNFRG